MQVLDLFCGAGGMSLGLKQAGFFIQRAYDFWEPALAVHEANLSTMTSRINGGKARRRNLGGIDIAQLKKVNEKGKPDQKAAALNKLIEELEAVGDLVTLIPEVFQLRPDIIVGGPPCQPWSQAGPRKGDSDPRARLTSAFATIVCAVRPQYFLMENVKQIQKSETFFQAKAMLKKAGYGLTETVVDAAYYGVPQARQRLLLIGCLSECDGWLDDRLFAAKSRSRMTVADVLGADFGKPHFQHQTSDGQKIWRAADAHTTDRTVNFYWLDPVWRQNDAGSRRVDRPVKTISRSVLARSSTNYPVKAEDVEDIKSLPVPTFEQLAQLGGFPATWKWSDVKAKGLKMRILANAVPPPLAAAVGRCIMAHHKGEPEPTMDTEVPKAFVTWLMKKKGFQETRLTQIVSEFKAVRRYFGSRTPDNVAAALEFVDRVPEFQRLGNQRKSNLRNALRLYSECEESFKFVLPSSPPDSAWQWRTTGRSFKKSAPVDVASSSDPTRRI